MLVLCCITASYPYAQQQIFDPMYYYLAGLVNDTDIENENYVAGYENLVDSQKMALELTEIYIKNVFGESIANKEKPYLIAGDKTKWIISGQVHRIKGEPLPFGGAFLIVISKIDGKVISLTKDR